MKCRNYTNLFLKGHLINEILSPNQLSLSTNNTQIHIYLYTSNTHIHIKKY